MRPPVNSEKTSVPNPTPAVDQVLDTKGLNCPLPILQARKAIMKMQAGEVLQVLSTDPGAVADFEAFCRQTGNELVESSTEDGVYTFLIKRAV
jgi:tRNA 2-thiouridine synthesizing protein A